MEQMQITKAINDLMQGQTPEVEGMELQKTLDGLEKHSTEELEQLLMDPSLAEGVNASLRDEILRILGERKGRDYVNGLVANATREPQADQAQINFDPNATAEKTPAERAREVLASYGNPLADAIPKDVKSFLVNADGAFYLELHEGRSIQMKDYDLVMDQVVTGQMESGVVNNLTGIKAVKEIYTEQVEIRFLGMEVSGNMIIITTDHPMAPKLQLGIDELIALR